MSKDQITQKEITNRQLSATIGLALAMKNHFELYSYRIWTPAQFLGEVASTIEQYEEVAKEIKQLDLFKED